MANILDYIILKKINETQNSIVYEAKKEDHEEKVVIKVLNTKEASNSDIARFKQEYELIRTINIDGIIKIYDFVQFNDTCALILENINGVSLKEFIKTNKNDISLNLNVAIKLAKILGYLHKNNIIHKDIKPHNIIINRTNNQVKITDFGIASILTHENEAIYNPEIIEGTLYYMSPEQTGRMNREVDYRTDLYSFGVTLYEMFTGIIPFRSFDPMEIIYSHIAREPEPIHLLNSSIPPILSNIVSKLLSKNAEDRYQNGFSLMEDLEECKKQLNDTGYIKDFKLAKHDVSIKFKIPQILIGREKELELLMSTFKRITTGAREMMVVTGQPGIGKTLLIQEIHKPVIAQKGYFITGEYEKFRKDVPYSAIIQAFQKLIKQLLIENQDMIEVWKNDFLTALGTNAKVLINVIPELEIIIGPQPEVPELGPEELHNRFIYLFSQLIKVFIKRNKPIVLFLDDLQWADSASFALINMLVTHPEIYNLYVICAYRDNEVGRSHPFMFRLKEIEKAGVKINNINITSLNTNQVNKLLSNFLHCDNDLSIDLAQLIHSKTNGNPFFINQFLKMLYEKNMLEFVPEKGWKWDLDQIASMNVTDNVVDLMIDKIKKLPDETRRLIQICSCIGNYFDLDTIAAISEKSIDVVLGSLTNVIDEGLIILSDNLYRFGHERIREAAYSIISDQNRMKIHYHIGRYLLKNTKKDSFAKKILFVVNQLNAGRKMISSDEDRYKAAKLNFQAGNKAKSTGAHESALIFYKIGIELLGDNCWQNHYNLAFTLYTNAAEAAFFSTKYEEMECLSDIALKNSKSLLDKASIYDIKIRTLVAQNKLIESLKLSKKILKRFGLSLPNKPNKIDLLQGLIKTKLTIGRKKPEDFLSFKEMDDPYALAKVKILSSAVTSAYWAVPELLPLIIFMMVQLGVKYGNSSLAAYNYAGYGLILINIGKIDEGYRYGIMAKKLVDQMNIQQYKGRPQTMMGAFIRHWKEHVTTANNDILEAYQIGLETGDTEYVAHCAIVRCTFLFLIEKKLENIKTEIDKCIKVIGMQKQEIQLNIAYLHKQMVLNLLGKADDPCRLMGDNCNEDIILSKLLKSNNKTGLCNLFLNKMILNYVFGNYQEALDNSFEFAKYMKSIVGSSAVRKYNFYHSLILLALFDSATMNDKKKYLKQVIKNQKKMEIWVDHAPMNNLHLFYLVEAEYSRVINDDINAQKFYENAIYNSSKNGFVHDEATSYELAARYYLLRGYKIFANQYMNRAYNCYKRWGANAKTEYLKKNYPELITDDSIDSSLKNITGVSGSFSSTGFKNIDLTTVFKVSEVLMSEINLDSLLEKIIALSLKNAGAKKCFLIMEHEEDNKLYIEAMGTNDGNISVLKSELVSRNSELAVSILNYVHQTGENIVLNDAVNDDRFCNDPYILKYKSKSVLCTPIIHQNEMVGIFYLENDLTKNAFSKERLDLLKIISIQAAISIENVRLLTHREQSILLKQEMEIAANIQTSLLPKNPDVKGYEISTYMKPADDVGGDYYDFINNEGYDWLVIGDVSGHGVKAGLVMMMVQTAIHFALNQNPKESPKELLVKLNQTITKNIKLLGEDKYMTITVFSFDNDGRFTYSGAHEDLLIYRADTGNIDQIKVDGMWIGILDDISHLLHNDKIKLNSGDVLFLYTDGIIESVNNEKKDQNYDPDDFFQHKNIIEVLKKSGMKSTEEIKDEILTRLNDYYCNDDVTMVVIKKE